MLANITVLIVSIGITLLSLQTKYDFTSCFHYMLMVSLVLAFVSSGIIIAVGSILNLIYSAIYAAIGAILVVLFLTIDAQLLISGKRKTKLTTNDFVFTSLHIYFDLFYIIYFPFSKKEDN